MLKLGARALLSLKLRRSERLISSQRQGSLPIDLIHEITGGPRS